MAKSASASTPASERLPQETTDADVAKAGAIVFAETATAMSLEAADEPASTATAAAPLAAATRSAPLSAPGSTAAFAPAGATAPAPAPAITPIPTPLAMPPAPKCSSKSIVVAQALCNVLGFLGVHRFYTGKTGTGIIWLLTCGCFLVGWMADAFMLSRGRFRDTQGLPIINATMRISPQDPYLHVCSSCDAVVSPGKTRCANCGRALKSSWQTTLASIITVTAVAIALTLVILWCRRYE